MKRRTIGFGLLAAALLAGCGRNGALRRMFGLTPKPAAEEGAPADPAGQPADGAGGFTLFPKSDEAAPADAEHLWAIRVASFEGSDRIARADHCAEQLRATEGVDPELVLPAHGGESSAVYYGRFARTGEGEFAPDPKPQLEWLRSLSLSVPDGYGNPQTVWPFRFATVEELPREQPTIDPGWLLTAAPGHYSLQVAVFYNTDTMQQRRFAAEEYCRLLRDEGEQAWLLHGPANSSVYIGSFAEEAIQSVSEPDPMTGATRVTRRIVDPELLALQERYPHNLHNGFTAYDVRRDSAGERVREPHPSFVVEVPRDANWRGEW